MFNFSEYIIQSESLKQYRNKFVFVFSQVTSWHIHPTKAYDAMIQMMQPAFPMFNIHVHVRLSVDLSKCDFSTDGNICNKDAKPLWCDFIP